MDIKADTKMVLDVNGKCELCNMYESPVADNWNLCRGHEAELQGHIHSYH